MCCKSQDDDQVYIEKFIVLPKVDFCLPPMSYTEYYVYILTNYSRTVLYTGVTNDIERRVLEHKKKFNPEAFTTKYKVDLLVWFETHNDVNKAIRREKLIKKWKRKWKEELINEENYSWEDLSKDWY